MVNKIGRVDSNIKLCALCLVRVFYLIGIMHCILYSACRHQNPTVKRKFHCITRGQIVG